MQERKALLGRVERLDHRLHRNMARDMLALDQAPTITLKHGAAGTPLIKVTGHKVEKTCLLVDDSSQEVFQSLRQLIISAT